MLECPLVVVAYVLYYSRSLASLHFTWLGEVRLLRSSVIKDRLQCCNVTKVAYLIDYDKGLRKVLF